MPVNTPAATTLIEAERNLLSQIDFDPNLGDSYERHLEIFEASHGLTMSLLNRDAISEPRWAYFTDPELNIGSKRSRAEIFEQNGTAGEEIFRHPHFLKFLQYFLYGPDLPGPTIAGFCRLVEDCEPVTSGDVEELCSYARQQTRQRSLDRRGAAEGFHKLALECGVEHYARFIRDAVFRLH